jgi:hypothetical protein
LVAAEAHGIEMVGTLDQVNRSRIKGDKEEEMACKQRERKQEDDRDGRVRAFWAEQGEDALKTRTRVNRWWEDWMQRYKAAEQSLHARWGIKGAKGGKESHPGETKMENDLDQLRNEGITSVVPCKRPSEEAK